MKKQTNKQTNKKFIRLVSIHVVYLIKIWQYIFEMNEKTNKQTKQNKTKQNKQNKQNKTNKQTKLCLAMYSRQAH